MKFKRYLFLAMVFILMLAVCFSFSACGDEENNGDDGEKSSTVTGSTTGSSVKDEGQGGTDNGDGTEGGSGTEDGSGTEGHEHDFDITVKKYPSANESGLKTYTCTSEGCGYTYDEEIESLLVSLPDVTAFLAPLFENGTYSIKTGENSKLIYVDELDNYELDTGLKGFLTVEMAEAELKQADGVVVGHLKLTFRIATAELDGTVDASDVAEPKDYDELCSLYLYVNGDDISIELESTSKDLKEKYEYDANQLICMALSDAFDIEYEYVLSMANIGNELKTYLPLVGGIVTSLGSVAIPDMLPESVTSFVGLLGNSIVSEKTDANGNIVYTLDIEALNEFLKSYDDATVADAIDALYGEGASDAIVSFVKELPDMTLKNVAVAAITFAEAYEVNVETTYELVNYIVYLATNETIDIEKEIESRYDNTLAQVVAELMKKNNPDLDENELASYIKSTLVSAADSVTQYTIDDIYNLIAYRDTEYVPEGAEEPYSIMAVLHGIVDSMKELVAVSVTVDQNGAVMNVSVNAGPLVANYTNDANGGYLVSVEMDGAELFKGTLTLTEEGFTLSGTASIDGKNASLLVEKDSTDVGIYATYGEYNIFTIKASVDEYGTLVSANVEIYGIDEEHDDEGNLVEAKNEIMFALTYTNNGDDTYSAEIVYDRYDISVNTTVSESGASTKVVVTDTKIDAVEATIDISLELGVENDEVTSVTYNVDVVVPDPDTTEEFSFSFYASKAGMSAIAKANEDELFKLEAVVDENGVLTSANVSVNIYGQDRNDGVNAAANEETSGETNELVNVFALSYVYDAANESGKLVVEFGDLPMGGLLIDHKKWEITFTPSTLNVKLINNCDDVAYNGAVMGELTVNRDENGNITEATFDLNTYENVENADVLSNWIHVSYIVNEDGKSIEFVNTKSEFELALEQGSLENGVSLSLSVKEGGEVMADGTLLATVVNTEGEKSLTIDLDVAKWLLSTYEMKKNETTNEDNAVSITETRYIILDGSITFAWEKAE